MIKVKTGLKTADKFFQKLVIMGRHQAKIGGTPSISSWYPCVPRPQISIVNRESYRYLCDEAVYQQLLVTFVLPSGGQILAIYYTHDMTKHATKNNENFGFIPLL